VSPTDTVNLSSAELPLVFENAALLYRSIRHCQVFETGNDNSPSYGLDDGKGGKGEETQQDLSHNPAVRVDHFSMHIPGQHST